MTSLPEALAARDIGAVRAALATYRPYVFGDVWRATAPADDPVVARQAIGDHHVRLLEIPRWLQASPRLVRLGPVPERTLPSGLVLP